MPPRTTRPAAPAQGQTSTGTSSKAGTAKASTGTSTKASTGTSTGADAQRNSQATTPVFFYGPLSLPEIFFKVCYGNKNPGPRIRNYHSFKPAVLLGHQRLCVKNDELPGITPSRNFVASGILVTGLTAAKLKKLDEFAGDRYERKSATANITKKLANGDLVNGDDTAAQAYVFKNKANLEMKEWDLEKFNRESKAKYTD